MAQLKDLVVNGDARVLGNFYSSENTYSTAETRIGVWIDGKPIYRKVYNITSPSASTTSLAMIDLQNVDQVISLTGFLIVSANAVATLNVSYDLTAYYAHAYYAPSQQKIYMTVGDDYRNKPTTIILEYTKTTD